MRKSPTNLAQWMTTEFHCLNPQNLKLSGDLCYHPVTIAQYALANYNLWKKKKHVENYESFLRCSTWIKDNNTYYKDHDSAIFYYDFDLRYPPVKAPWYSGMAQGQILSLLVRGYHETRNKEFLEVGKKVSNPLRKTFDQLGCVSYLDGQPFIQEVASDPKLYILNGALYGIIGLVEFRDYLGERDSFLEEILEGLRILLPKFDLGFWSRYSLGMRFNLSDSHYQKVHHQQLTYLGTLVNDDMLLDFGNRFKVQLEKNQTWVRPVLTLSLTINRVLRFLGFSQALYKF